MFPSFLMFPYVTTWSKTLSPLYIYIMCMLMPQMLTPLHGFWLHVAKTNNQLVHEVAVHNWGRRGRRWFPYKNNLHHPWSILTPTSPWSKVLEEIIQNGNFQLNPPPLRLPTPWPNYIELWTPFLGAQRWALSSIWNVHASIYTNMCHHVASANRLSLYPRKLSWIKIVSQKLITLYMYSYSNNNKMTIHIFGYCGSKYLK
jgi:hypothetical protein